MRGRAGSAVLLLAVCFAVGPPASAAAQAVESVLYAPRPERPGAERSGPTVTPVQADGGASPARTALGGVLGGAGGFFGLGFLGAWAADETSGPGEDLAAVGGFALGGLVGEVLGVAGGVHLAAGRRGSFWTDLGASALGAAATLGTLALLDGDGPSMWAVAGAGVALQVGLTVRAELRGR